MQINPLLILALFAVAGVIAVVVVARAGEAAFLFDRKVPAAGTYFVEHARFTGGGILCLILLVLWNIALAAGFVFGTRVAVSEIAFALVWLGGNQMIGLGVLIGRRRAFVAQRAPDQVGDGVDERQS